MTEIPGDFDPGMTPGFRDRIIENSDGRFWRAVTLLGILALFGLILFVISGSTARAHDIIPASQTYLIPYSVSWELVPVFNGTGFQLHLNGQPQNGSTGSYNNSATYTIAYNTTVIEVNYTSINQTLCPEAANITQAWRETQDALRNHTDAVILAVANNIGPSLAAKEAAESQLKQCHDMLFNQVINSTNQVSAMSAIGNERDFYRSRGNLMIWLALTAVIGFFISLVIHYKAVRS